MITKIINTIGRCKVIQCKRCGYIYNTGAEKVTVCYRCGKSMQMVSKGKNKMTGFNIKILFHSSSERDVVNYLQEYRKKFNNKSDDFRCFDG